MEKAVFLYLPLRDTGVILCMYLLNGGKRTYGVKGRCWVKLLSRTNKIKLNFKCLWDLLSKVINKSDPYFKLRFSKIGDRQMTYFL